MRLFREDEREIVAQALAEHAPIARFVGFSGGGDSIVAAHWAITNGYAEGLFHIDTGIAVPGVREFVEDFAQNLGAPLTVYEAGSAYWRLVLGRPEWWIVYRREARDGESPLAFRARMKREDRKVPGAPLGFPGPAQHGRAYSRIKERQFEALLRDVKVGHPNDARMLMLTGIRREESQRRRTRQPITRRFSLVFANPLIDWTDHEMAEYRTRHGLVPSDVSALLHMSGECTCGAYASPGEREMLRSLWPEWWAKGHGRLEIEAAELGLPCVWGERPPPEFDDPDDPEAGEFCSSCPTRDQLALDLA